MHSARPSSTAPCVRTGSRRALPQGAKSAPCQLRHLAERRPSCLASHEAIPGGYAGKVRTDRLRASIDAMTKTSDLDPYTVTPLSVEVSSAEPEENSLYPSVPPMAAARKGWPKKSRRSTVGIAAKIVTHRASSTRTIRMWVTHPEVEEDTTIHAGVQESMCRSNGRHRPLRLAPHLRRRAMLPSTGRYGRESRDLSSWDSPNLRSTAGCGRALTPPRVSCTTSGQVIGAGIRTALCAFACSRHNHAGGQGERNRPPYPLGAFLWRAPGWTAERHPALARHHDGRGGRPTGRTRPRRSLRINR
jgi:hypothetical protein